MMTLAYQVGACSTRRRNFSTPLVIFGAIAAHLGKPRNPFANINMLRNQGDKCVFECGSWEFQLATFWNEIRVLIRRDNPALKAPICSWIYVRNVLLLQRPTFMIVALSAPLSLTAMAPEARKEWDPIRSGV